MKFENIGAITFLVLLVAVSLFSIWYQSTKCSVEFTEHGHPVTVCTTRDEKEYLIRE